MKLLIVGGGGREHALAWRVRREAPEAGLLAAPGNPGIAALGATCHAVRADDVPALVALAAMERVDLVIVGPEAPLALGLVDACRQRGIAAFGPTAAAAQLETSKAFAKQLMLDAGVPTARATMHADVPSALAAVRALGAPVVVKASGLAAGKGVVVAGTIAEAEAAVRDMLEGNAFGDAGHEVLVEECMTGEELSLFVLTDGTRALPLPAAQDHKRIGEGDTGPNTGGMGAYCPADAGDAAFTPRADGGVAPGIARVMETIVHPVLAAMRARGTPFTGLLYCGLMLTPEGPKVVEFNCRFGDPETQAVLPALGDDARLLDAMLAIGRGDPLPTMHFTAARATVTTVVAAAGYPASVTTGDAIALPALADGATIFHAGTRTTDDGTLVTAGGRVLAVTATGATLRDAQRASLDAAAAVRFAGAQYRRDIGWRALARDAGAS
jgi:phosphoribosylamine--glycine ligase